MSPDYSLWFIIRITETRSSHSVKSLSYLFGSIHQMRFLEAVSSLSHSLRSTVRIRGEGGVAVLKSELGDGEHPLLSESQ